MEESQLVIANKPDLKSILPKTISPQDILIIGSKFNMTKIIYHKLKSIGYSQVLCQKLYVSNKDINDDDGHDFRDGQRRFIFDLNHMGAIKLSYCDGRCNLNVYNP